MKRKGLAAALALLLAASPGMPGIGPAAAEEADSLFTENEWNYVSESLDANRGVPENAEGALARIERDGVLWVAADLNAAPQVYTEPEKSGTDRYAGADMKLARRIAEKLGAELKIVPLDETQVLPALTEEQVDLTISAVSYNPRRALSYTLSKAYWYPDTEGSVGVLIREADREHIASEADLTGLILEAPRHSLAEATAIRHAGNYLEFRRPASVLTVIEDVRDGRADAAFLNVRTAEIYLGNNPDSGLTLAEGLRLTPDRTLQGYRVAARKGETQLIAFVNGVIDEMTEEGAYGVWLEEAMARCAELGL